LSGVSKICVNSQGHSIEDFINDDDDDYNDDDKHRGITNTGSDDNGPVAEEDHTDADDDDFNTNNDRNDTNIDTSTSDPGEANDVEDVQDKNAEHVGDEVDDKDDETDRQTEDDSSNQDPRKRNDDELVEKCSVGQTDEMSSGKNFFFRCFLLRIIEARQTKEFMFVIERFVCYLQ